MSSDMDDEVMELFYETLTSNGIAASTVDDGVVVAFTADKLRGMLAKASADDEGTVFIHISTTGETTDEAEEDELQMPIGVPNKKADLKN